MKLIEKLKELGIKPNAYGNYAESPELDAFIAENNLQPVEKVLNRRKPSHRDNERLLDTITVFYGYEERRKGYYTAITGDFASPESTELFLRAVEKPIKRKLSERELEQRARAREYKLSLKDMILSHGLDVSKGTLFLAEYCPEELEDLASVEAAEYSAANGGIIADYVSSGAKGESMREELDADHVLRLARGAHHRHNNTSYEAALKMGVSRDTAREIIRFE